MSKKVDVRFFSPLLRDHGRKDIAEIKLMSKCSALSLESFEYEVDVHQYEVEKKQ